MSHDDVNDKANDRMRGGDTHGNQAQTVENG